MKYFLSILSFLFFYLNAYSQCQNLTPLEVINPSFEGPRGAHITPAPWSTCGITPDTQPGSWGINLPPSDGSSYVGFVNGGSSWLEGASQQLSGNMQAGVQYQFTIDLAAVSSGSGGINPAPSSINIYGANSICSTTELLWSSPTVSNTTWQTYTVTFTPSQNFTHIYFRINQNSPNMSYILLDNITPIYAQEPNIFITSHQNGDNENCSFNISGTVTHSITQSVILTGNFVGSPLTANLNGLNWNANLVFNGGGNQTITATANYTDPATQSASCVYTTVDLIVNSPTADFNFVNTCQDSPVQITDASSPYGNTTLTDWAWDFGDGNTSSLQSPTHTYSTPGQKTITLNLTASDGCVATLSKTIEIYDLPNTTFSASDVCVGSSTAFNNTSSIANGNITSWNWDFGDGNTSTNQAPTHDYTSHGTYNVTLTSTSNNNCSTSSTVTVNVFAMPQVNYSFTDDCLYEEVTFTNNTSIATGSIASWSWDFGNGVSSSEETPVYTYPTDGTFTTSLTATSDNGCIATLSQQITRFPVPNASFNVNPECLYNALNFNNTSTINAPDNITSWVWNFDDGSPFDGTENPSHTFPSEGSYNVNLMAISNNGCIGTVSNTAIVHPIPVPNFSSTTVCENTPPTEFTNLSSIVTGTLTQFSWSFGDNNTASIPNPSNTYTQYGVYDVELTVTSEYGCEASIALPVTVLEAPTIDFSSNNTEGCSPVCVNFTDLSSNSTATTIAWEWKFGNETTSLLQSPHICFENLSRENDSAYSVELTTTNDLGCSSTLLINDYITVFHNPLASFEITPPQTNMYETEIEFINQSLGANNYLWNFDDSNESTETNPYHTFADTGSYNIQLIAFTEHGCTDTAYNIIRVDAVTNFYVPNTFTPNGDGYNDVFNIIGFNLEQIEFSIFNKWGTMIFYTDDLNRGWDGTFKGQEAKTDNYIWKVKVTDGFGETKTYTGHVFLMR